MKNFKKTIITMLFVSLLLGACSKEEKEELQPVSNSIVTGQCTTTSQK